MVRTSTHWGAYDIEVKDGKVVALHPFADDPDPSPIGQSIPGALDTPARIREPMIRKGWLDNGPRGNVLGRGGEPFVAVSWNEALDLVAGELRRVRSKFGNDAIFGGSYGWASAGRFHHAQSQIHRFLNFFGGYVSQVNSYSLAAGDVAVSRVLGESIYANRAQMTSWPVIAEHTKLMVMFGGIPEKNGQVVGGGAPAHTNRVWLRRCCEQGTRFVNISPIRNDANAELDAEWWPIRPNTDVAVMLALAQVLVAEGLHDADFLQRCCTGFERFRDYLMGREDGVAKTPEWAGAIADIAPDKIRTLARRMAGQRTMINVSWSLQRADHGEQAFWACIALAAVLGQIGLPGGGFGLGYGAMNQIGDPSRTIRGPVLPQGENPLKTFIPVARIADALLAPGTTVDYDGRKLIYPDIRLIYWAGGNPFHHHQDLNRMLRAWQKPETIVVHEPFWNAHARHADIVLPVTTPFERNDIGCRGQESVFFAMHKAIEPIGLARSDYDILAPLAERLGFGDSFTEGRNEEQWLRHLYTVFRQRAASEGVDTPVFDEFWQAGHFAIPKGERRQIMYEGLRSDPVSHSLGTPSGKIELFSETVAGFAYDDCPGHAKWLEPFEWLGASAAKRFPLHMISNQPDGRLHSQFDHGRVSLESKVQGREPVWLHPDDAASRGVKAGDVVRVFNDRGACLAGVVVTDSVRPGVVRLATGAWYDPLEPGRIGSLCVHGNPNVLTRDKGTSKLAQGPSAMSTLVEVERWQGKLPPVRAFDPPPIERRRTRAKT
ncbi:MAG: Asp-tRNA(Asn)/Glu-tRNA(Gln) amidotransferase GatCAB subunit C [Alphaproteobacteria bacterium]|nr:Asp-tRNA(Asn)/Glu-tRNA(Gln) amidotransferase GatCAB subunit C [Alphaproteobacteria bacterium]